MPFSTMSRDSKMNEEFLGQPLRELADRGFSLALRILRHREDAADTVQDALFQMVASASQFDRSRGSVRAWFLTIVRNRCIDQMKKKRPVQIPEQHETVDDAQKKPENELENNEWIATVRHAITKMDPDAREILLLRDYDGLSYAEIANVLDIPNGTVMSRIYRARKQLRTIVGASNDSIHTVRSPLVDLHEKREASS